MSNFRRTSDNLINRKNNFNAINIDALYIVLVLLSVLFCASRPPLKYKFPSPQCGRDLCISSKNSSGVCIYMNNVHGVPHYMQV